MSKPALREKLAALSFSEKIKILEKLRDRSLVIAASGLRKKANSASSPVIKENSGSTSHSPS